MIYENWMVANPDHSDPRDPEYEEPGTDNRFRGMALMRREDIEREQNELKELYDTLFARRVRK